jgi:hypothetical protein
MTSLIAEGTELYGMILDIMSGVYALTESMRIG